MHALVPVQHPRCFASIPPSSASKSDSRPTSTIVGGSGLAALVAAVLSSLLVAKLLGPSQAPVAAAALLAHPADASASDSSDSEWPAAVYQPPAQARKRNIVVRVVLTLVEALLVSLRVTELLLRFTPALCTAPFAFLVFSDASVWRDRWWSLFVHTLESCGPTFIKLGQWASTRRDLFPTKMCAQLSRLHGRSKQHSFEQTLATLKSSLNGQPIESVFAGIEREPIGSGCVAQVHKAVLAGSGDLVAVKVLHPGVQSKIVRDILILDIGASVLEKLVPSLKWLSLVDSVANFSSLMTTQLDLRLEGKNLERFARNFRGIDGIRFPVPYLDVSSESVLVESYEPGVSLNRFIRDPSNPANLRLGELGLHSFLKMMILDNFIHGDLHPGNMLVQQMVHVSPGDAALRKKDARAVLAPQSWFASSPSDTPAVQSSFGAPFQSANDRLSQQSATQMDAMEGDSLSATSRASERPAEANAFLSSEWLRSATSGAPRAEPAKDMQPVAYYDRSHPETAQLLLLDAGIVTELSPRDRVNFIDLFTAVAKGQGRVVGEMMIDRARDQQCTDREGFVSSVDNLVKRVRKETLKLGKIKVADILNEMFSLVCEYRVKMESNFVSLAVSIMVLEGIGRSLDPNIDLLAASLPLLESLKSDQGLLEGHISETQAGAIRGAVKIYSRFKWVLSTTDEFDLYSSASPIVLFGVND